MTNCVAVTLVAALTRKVHRSFQPYPLSPRQTDGDWCSSGRFVAQPFASIWQQSERTPIRILFVLPPGMLL